MIRFKYVTYKNFLSTGDQGVTINLDRSSTTLIVGSNGVGKSSFLDQLTFCLFGKSYRGIPKPLLINSTNERGMYTEVGFEIGSDEYVIKRGMKPHVFEVIKNGQALDQDAASRDQQKYIETVILKTSFKPFTQVIMLGSAQYIPFMQLSTGARREVIESLLDIGIFSDMYRVLRGRVSRWKDEMSGVNEDLSIVESQMRMQREFIEKMRGKSDGDASKQVEELQQIRDSLQRNKQRREEIESKIQSLLVDRTTLLEKEIQSLEELYKKNDKVRFKIDGEMAQIQKRIDFFEKTSECIACSQKICDDHKVKQTEELAKKYQESQLKRKEIDEVLHDTNKEVSVLKDIKAQIDQLNKEKDLIQGSINLQVKSAKKLMEQISESKQSNKDTLEKEKETLLGYRQQHKLLHDRKIELLREKEVLDFSIRLLKDEGIKAKIIKQYIPIINQSVNKYLATMNFSTKFHLDENFNETLKSRHRDDFTYNNFSMGERQRIDLALLFAWREVAKMKNSVNCNLLIFDEIFDSSLDSEGTEDLLSILQSLDPQTRIFVISHKNLMEDKFRSVINFGKVKDFSRIV